MQRREELGLTLASLQREQKLRYTMYIIIKREGLLNWPKLQGYRKFGVVF